VAAIRVWLANEDVSRCAAAAYAFEEPGIDELRKVVRRLGTAHAAEGLVASAGQRCRAPVAQKRQRALLRRL
jgi:hypothetical protein